MAGIGSIEPGAALADHSSMKLALVSTVLCCGLLGCTQPRNSGPVFSEVPGVPSEASSQPALPEPAKPVPPTEPAPAVFSAPPADNKGELLFIYAQGAFMRPGRIAWTNGMSLQDGIQAAGGLSPVARRRILLFHADGLAERIQLGPKWTLTNNPALKPGDKIVSPQE